MPPIIIEGAVALIELAAKWAPVIYDAIRSNGEYTDEQKAALVARVKAARSAVAAYEPRDV
jgi:hypothetical protein